VLVSTPSLFFLGNAQKIRLIPVGPLLFQRIMMPSLLLGRIRSVRLGLHLINLIIETYGRVPWYETIWVQLGLVGFCAIVFLSACIIWPIRPLICRGKRFQVERREPILIAGLAGTLNLVFLIGFPCRSGYTAYGSLCMVYLPSRSPFFAFH